MKFEKIDKIVLTHDEYYNISKWVDEREFDSVDIVLHECLVVMDDIKNEQFNFTAKMGIYFKVDEKTGYITVQQYDMSDEQLMMTGYINEAFFSDGKIEYDIDKKYLKFLGEDHIQKALKIAVLTVLNIFQYMSNCEQNVVVKEHAQIIRKPPKKKSKYKSNKPRTVKVKTTHYTFTDKPISNKKYDRHIDSWSVRGHWRYYKKSGKKVWINAHTKGINKPEQGKIYKI